MNKTSIFSYILTKLTAACLLSLLLTSLTLSGGSGLTRYKFLTGLHELLFTLSTLVIVSYAILCSVFIDKVKFKNHSTLKKVCLYILCGYLFFLPFLIFKETNFLFVLFAGSIGAIFSVFFYLCTLITKKFIWIGYIIPIVILITLITINFVDVTQKEQWTEKRTQNSFEASFQHFSGEHKIPIELKRGDILEFTIESPSENPNAYMGDIKMSSEFQEEENYLASNGPNTYQFAAIKTGTYYIIVSGNKLKGKLKVDWNIK
ncbi:PPC domain-containing protein [Bacillus paramycoides]|uniref:PPC domain-containing protein n=1 Tax=Bacillus TaxID=1386 RepID=UPI00065370C3|nr:MULTISPECIES: PPC domain-containing protein [Bacillus]KMN42806.1 hypothetical protein VK90_22775 [Bacillus sp. LK2]NWK71765.1 PPC domain-containing protein [Bacillus paramycoides]